MVHIVCRVTRSYVFALSRKQSVPSTGNVYMDRLQPSCVAFGVPGIPILMQISYERYVIYIYTYMRDSRCEFQAVVSTLFCLVQTQLISKLSVLTHASRTANSN